ncbi:MAG: polyphenol oxidase family protein [Candidatus Peribacteraceae bacterium]|nr:polyphenol oxidase family protein [Candidatus Peribacteraceae bacterium]
MSTDPFSLFSQFSGELSLGLFTKEHAAASYEDIAQELGAQSFARVHQVHGNRAVRIHTAANATEDADGMLASVPGLALCISCADCQAFVIYAPKKRALGALHVGWRGLIGGAIEKFFDALKKECNIDASDTFVAAGPSLCMKCAEFSDPAQELPNVNTRFIRGRTVNLRGAAQERFEYCGVRPERFERHSDCTCCNRERYWTYRGGDQLSNATVHTNVFAAALMRE